MGRIRTVKPQLFRSHDLYKAEQSVNANRGEPFLNVRFTFVGLFTVADRSGRFKWQVEELKVDCLPYDQVNFEEILNVLLMHGDPPFIVKYEVDGKYYGFITGFPEHQRPHHTEPDSTLPSPSSENTVKTPCPHRDLTAKEGKGRERKGSNGRSAKSFAGVKPKSLFNVYMDSVLGTFYSLKPGDPDPKEKKAVSAAYGRWGKFGSEIMAFARNDVEIAKRGTGAIVDRMQSRGLDCSLRAVANNFLDWFNDQEGYERETKNPKR